MEKVIAGWDSRATIVDGVWLEREPLRAEVEDRLITETSLLPWLAPQLPLPVPVPAVVQENPLRVRHRLIPGAPAHQLSGNQAASFGRFFRALHSVDIDAAVARGVPAGDVAWEEHLRHLGRFRREILPRLKGSYRRLGEALLERLAHRPDESSLVHGDVGPAHLLLHDDRASGVIDWSDAQVGDTALDLAWLLHGSGHGEAVARAYDADEALLPRARDWHMLGPWHEVTYGLDYGGTSYVKSGMAGVLARLA